MSACEGYEIAIEMRLHGAADDGPFDRLDAHLATCAACREFEASARHTEETMKRETDQIASHIDWRPMRARLQRIQWEYRLLPLLLLASIVLAVAVFAAVRVVVPVVAFVSVVLVLWLLSASRSAARLREARKAEQSREALLASCRQELDQRIRRLSGVGWLLPPACATPLLFLTAWNAHRAHASTSLLVLTDKILPLFFVALAFYARFVRLPRILREREELS